jgi:hypothetical protein
MKRCMPRCWTALIAGLVVCLSQVGAIAAPGDIIITEVMFDATDNNVWQWIEIKNAGAAPIDMNGYYGFNLGDTDIVAGPNDTIDATLDPANPLETIINPGEVAVIYDGFYATNNPDNHLDSKFRAAWPTIPAATKLISADFFPGFFNSPNPQGYSVGFWNSVANWRADMTPPGGGAGAVTSSFNSAEFSLNFSTFPVTGTVNGNSSITWTGNGSNQDGGQWVQSVSGSNGATTSTLVTIAGGDTGNPGIVTGTGTFPANPSNLYITEIMYNPIGSEPNFEWVEVFNNGASAVDLTGYVLDDTNATAHSAINQPNIAGGSIPAGGTAILYNSAITATDFTNLWGAGLNLVPVTDWTSAVMSLNNSGADGVGLWSSTASYAGDQQAHANAVASLKYDLANGWPLATNQSIYITTRNNSTTDPFSWSAASAGVDGSYSTGNKHPGGDVASPGVFTAVAVGQAGDFDGDLDVDGRDFLIWQRGGSTPGGPLSAGDLADWQANYGVGTGPLTATTAVPEPASLAMIALALVPVAFGRKR